MAARASWDNRRVDDGTIRPLACGCTYGRAFLAGAAALPARPG